MAVCLRSLRLPISVVHTPSYQATACLKRAQYLAPFDWSIQFNLGLVHLRGGQHASAFHFLKAASNLNPRSSEAFGWLGVTLAYLDDEDNAFSAFERALQLDRYGDGRGEVRGLLLFLIQPPRTATMLPPVLITLPSYVITDAALKQISRWPH